MAKKRTMSASQKKALAKGRLALKKKQSAKKPAKKKRTVKKAVENKSLTTMGGFVAKRKTTKKPSVRRKISRKVSSLMGGRSGAMETLKTVGFTVGGGIAAGMLANRIPVKDPRVKAVIPIAAGVLLASTMGRKNAMVKNLATGMAVLGAVALFKQMAPQVPMLAGEVAPELSYQNSDLALLGETVNYGDDYDNDDITDLEGESVDFGGDDQYFSPADL